MQPNEKEKPMSKILIAGLFVCAAAAPAFAQPTNMNLLIQQVGGPSWNYQADSTRGTWGQVAGSPPNQWRYTGDLDNSAFHAEWQLDLDADPFVSNNFALTNNTAVTQTFVVSVILPVFPVVVAPSTTFGSVSMTVGDTNNSGNAILTTTGPGSSIYTALIDGGTYQTLANDPFLLQTSPFPPGATNAAGPFNFFFPAGQPGVLSTIGLTNTFTLTPGDSVTMVSTFRIDPIIPAPATAVLAALAGAVATRRRRV